MILKNLLCGAIDVSPTTTDGNSTKDGAVEDILRHARIATARIASNIGLELTASSLRCAALRPES
jgi:hypothetical protein